TRCMASRFSKIQSVFLDLSEFQINRCGTAEDQNRNLNSALLVINFFHHATEVGKRPVNDAHHLTGFKQSLRLGLVDPTFNTLQDRISFAISNRRRLFRSTTDKAHYARRRLDQVPSLIIHFHVNQHITRIELALAFTLLSIAHFHHFFSGDQNIAKPLFQALQDNALLQRTHHLLFITGIGVHNITTLRHQTILLTNYQGYDPTDQRIQPPKNKGYKENTHHPHQRGLSKLGTRRPYDLSNFDPSLFQEFREFLAFDCLQGYHCSNDGQH